MTNYHYQSVVELYRHRAEERPKDSGYVFLKNGETEHDKLTYGDLDKHSQAIAAVLRADCSPGDRALLIYQPGLDFIAAFLGCLYAGIIAVPVFPPHPLRLEQALPRLSAIASNAAVSVVLSTTAFMQALDRIMAQLSVGNNIKKLCTDAISLNQAGAWQAPAINPETIALLQYTSGSTASPKGVMVSHANLLATLSDIHAAEHNTLASRSVTWLPPYHDMGLIEGLLVPAYSGFPVYIMAPTAFLQRPLRWLQAISRFRATNSGGPNFAYELCLQKITPEQRQQLDLSYWRVAYNGSEPIRSQTVFQFSKTFAECGFKLSSARMVYGLAEATLLVSASPAGSKPMHLTLDTQALAQDSPLIPSSSASTKIDLMSCGKPLPSLEVVIVDPYSQHRLQPGQIGEIWLAGPSITQGYWNAHTATQRTFAAYLCGETARSYLRTGDLGFMHRGELFVTGRIKDIIIVRGRKLYPQDIEDYLKQHLVDIRSGSIVAVPLPAEEGERLAIIVELRKRTGNKTVKEVNNCNSQYADIIALIREAIAEQYGVQAALVSLVATGSVTKTSSGKLQRLACRERLLNGELEVLQQWQQPSRNTVPSCRKIA